MTTYDKPSRERPSEHFNGLLCCVFPARTSIVLRGKSFWELAPFAPVWWRVVRKPDSLETLCSRDGKNFSSVRMGYLVPSATAEVGIMCAAPEGEGFQCIFDSLNLTTSGK
jgi:uncharacterized protein